GEPAYTVGLQHVRQRCGATLPACTGRTINGEVVVLEAARHRMAEQEEGNADEGEHEDERYGEQDTHPVDHLPTPPTLLGPALLASHAPHLACFTAVLRHARPRRGALSPSCVSPDQHARSACASLPR